MFRLNFKRIDLNVCGDQVDDPVDAFPIHFCGGLAGLLTAPFLIPQGIFFRRDAQSAVVRA